MRADERPVDWRRDLSPAGAIERLDRAVAMVRAGGVGLAGRAWGAGAALAGVALAGWYLEMVEGVRTLRPILALAGVLAWWARAVVLGGVARAHVTRLWPDAPIPEGAGRGRDVARTAAWAAVGLWIGGWVVVAGALAGPVGVVLVAPLFAIRGALAPGWIARAGCGRDAGLAALRGALADSSGQRFAGLIAELLVLLGAIGLAVNLLGAVAVGSLLGRSMLGLDLATVDAFLSARNTFLLVVVALGVLVAIEPLRSALSAATWVEARVRAEGLDLRLAIDDAIARGRGRRAASRVALVLVLVAGAARASAQVLPPPPLPPGFAPGAAEPTPPPEEPPVPDVAVEVVVESEIDAAARADAEAILAGPAFREHDDTRGRGLRALIEGLLEWIFRHRDPIEPPAIPRPTPIPLPGPMVFVALALVVAVMVAMLLYATRPMRRGPRLGAAAPGDEAPSALDPRERAPDAWIDDAARLAAEGRHREALRALYLATLVALDRRRLIRFDPTLTNGQYLRQMPEGEARADFRDFTRRFDCTWYGEEPASEHDYRACRALADRIVALAAGGAG